MKIGDILICKIPLYNGNYDEYVIKEYNKYPVISVNEFFFTIIGDNEQKLLLKHSRINYFYTQEEIRKLKLNLL